MACGSRRHILISRVPLEIPVATISIVEYCDSGREQGSEGKKILRKMPAEITHPQWLIWPSRVP